MRWLSHEAETAVKVAGRHRVRRGFDIPVMGKPETGPVNAAEPGHVGACAGDIPGFDLRALVRVGDRVKRGDPVLSCRRGSGVYIVAPAAGEVAAIKRGANRAPWCVAIAPDGSGEARECEVDDPLTCDSDALAESLRASGLWLLLRERPLGRLAIGGPPAAVFVNAMDTEPLAADPMRLLAGREQDFETGIAVLRRLNQGPMYLCVRAKVAHTFGDLPGVEVHEFAGPHPAGLPGTHIDRIAPLRSGQRYWTVRAQDVVRIGEWARTRTFPTHRVIALSGPAMSSPGYVRVRDGSQLAPLVGELDEDTRLIQGTLLAGEVAAGDDYLSTTVHTLTAISDGEGRRTPFGWLLPRLDRPSASASAFGWLRRKHGYDVDARLHGQARPLVDIGAWDRVMPLDIHLSYLVRAIQVGDLEEAVALGLLDVTEEDVALCTYVDPCKSDIGSVIRRGLDLYAREHER